VTVITALILAIGTFGSVSVVCYTVIKVMHHRSSYAYEIHLAQIMAEKDYVPYRPPTSEPEEGSVGGKHKKTL
jgi:hypothetical protein